jgi:hypothetical protein
VPMEVYLDEAGHGGREEDGAAVVAALRGMRGARQGTAIRFGSQDDVTSVYFCSQGFVAHFGHRPRRTCLRFRLGLLSFGVRRSGWRVGTRDVLGVTGTSRRDFVCFGFCQFQFPCL